MSLQQKNRIRTRFAPSPTGGLHPGGARTALVNYLFAKSQNGQFVLRVEDTDQARGEERFLQEQLKDLEWLNLCWDEGPANHTSRSTVSFKKGAYGPYRQSERLSLYQKYADTLIQEGKAYYCFLTEEEIQQLKQAFRQKNQPYRPESIYRDKDLKQAKEKLARGEQAVIRFKSPEGKKNYVLKDVVRGEVVFPSDMVGDFVLMRSSGLPVYNFACAVDDHLMNISHVFRSEEHLPNTLRQMMIFEAFNWPLPVYGHLSLILGENKKKLSKREGALSCGAYREKGYLPQAFLNFLALMGWNPKTEKEIFSLSELEQAFSLKGLNPAPGVFDPKKLSWFNSRHLSALTEEQMLKALTPFLEREQLKLPVEENWRKKAVTALRSSFSSLLEAVALFRLFSSEHWHIDKKACALWEWPLTGPVAEEWKTFLESYPNEEMKVEDFSKALKNIQQKTGAKGRFLFMPLRGAMLGQAEGLELKAIISLLPRSLLLKRAGLFLSSKT